MREARVQSITPTGSPHRLAHSIQGSTAISREACPDADGRFTKRATTTSAAAILSLILALLAATASAQPDPASWPVAPAHSAAEVGPTIIRDGAGGAFVAFKAYSYRVVPPNQTVEDHDLHVARLFPDAQPDPAWNSARIGGFWHVANVPAVVATTDPGRVWLVTDRFVPSLTGGGGKLARPVGDAGLLQPDLSQAGTSQHAYNSLLVLSSGRLLVASKGQFSVDVSFIESDGSLNESVSSLTMPGSWAWDLGNLSGPRALADASGGAWVLGEYMSPAEPGARDVAMGRLAADGTAANSPAFRVVCSATRDQREAVIAPDGADGVFVAWTDRRDLSKAGDIFASRVLADGSVAPGWPLQGKPIASLAGDQYLPAIAADGAGGIWLAWIDASSGENDIRYTHVLADGNLASGFSTGGSPLCAAGGSQVDPTIAADGAGGFYALWRDQRDGEIDLFGQHIHSSGVVMLGWPEDGLPISTDGTPQRDAGLVVLDPHHALAAWVDTRLGYEKVFAALLPADLPVAGVTPPRSPAISLRAVQSPARGTVEMLVSSTSTATVRVALHDLSGRSVAEQTIEGPLNSTRVRFETRTLEPGLYFARAWADKASASARVTFVR